MIEPPAPLVPVDCDLTGYGFMPLHGHRLFGSDFNARCSDSEWRAGVTLWWAAWNQVPAGSLPDDDMALCRLADLGRDTKTWRRLRANALHGWTKASDGRLYHPVLARLAIEAWDRRIRDRERKAKWRTGRDASGDGDNRRGDGDRHGDGHAEAKRSEAKRSDIEANLEGETTAPPPNRGAQVVSKPRAKTKPAAPPEPGSHDHNLRRAAEAKALVGRLRRPDIAEHIARADADIQAAAAKLLADERNAWTRSDDIATVRGWIATAEAAP